jgi:hypothetical protein
MRDARIDEKMHLEYLDSFTLKKPLILVYQPPPVTITLEPGKTFETVQEEFKEQIHAASREGLSSMLRQCDDTIREQRPRGVYHNCNFGEKTIATWCGDVVYKRAAYTDQENNHRYLCDEVLGMSKGQRISVDILLRALVMAGSMSYEKVMKFIEEWTGIKRSPETYRRWVLRMGEYIQTWIQGKRATIFDTPVSSSDEYLIDPEYLFLEADGCYIYMRIPRESEGKKGKGSAKKEVRLGLFYEGKRPRHGTIGNGKYEVTGKTYFGGLMDVDDFIEIAATLGYERYGLGPFTTLFCGGDGANWIGPHFVEFLESLFILCRYHWKRDIFRLFPEDEAKRVIGLVESNDKAQTDVFFEQQCEALINDAAKVRKVKELKTYLFNQWKYIQNYRILREWVNSRDPALARIGVIEGHIYQVLYLRFESRGGYWSKDGLNALLHVLMAKLNGNLAQLVRASQGSARKKVTVSAVLQAEEKPKQKPALPCVQADFPALKHSRRQLQKLLKKMAHPEGKRVA